MSKLRLMDLGKSYEGPAGEKRHVIQGLSWEFPAAGITTIVGPNGCGKSTLLGVISGMIDADRGTVSLDNVSSREPRFAFVWQNYRASLLPWLTAVENVEFPLRIRGVAPAARRPEALRLLDHFGPTIQPNARVYSLSGGQQQLLCFLRGLITEPDCLLMDEPFSALDQQTRWALIFQLEEIWLRRRIPTILVSHDVDEAVVLGDEILLMSAQPPHISAKLTNPLPRPRSVNTLSEPEHLRLRAKLIEFLFSSPAGQPKV